MRIRTSSVEAVADAWLPPAWSRRTEAPEASATRRDRNPTGSRWGREPSEISGQQETTMDNDAAGQPACPQAVTPLGPRLQRRGHFPSCRAAFAACLRVVGLLGRASPYGQGGSQRHHSLPGRFTGRATSVPFTAVPTGIQRTITDNTMARSTSAAPYLRRWSYRPIWLWEQGVNVPDVAIELSQAAQVGAQ
jgi:hypothetical protein